MLGHRGFPTFLDEAHCKLVSWAVAIIWREGGGAEGLEGLSLYAAKSELTEETSCP